MEPTTTAARDAERALLRERARALARPLAADTNRGEQRPALLFTVGTEHYAVETRFVRSVTRPTRVTQLPGALPHVRGLISVRGRALPLIDIPRLLGRDFTSQGPRFAAVLGQDSGVAAIMTDAVDEVVTLYSQDRLDAAPPRTRFELGLYPGPVTLLDGRLLLDEIVGTRHQAPQPRTVHETTP